MKITFSRNLLNRKSKMFLLVHLGNLLTMLKCFCWFAFLFWIRNEMYMVICITIKFYDNDYYPYREFATIQNIATVYWFRLAFGYSCFNSFNYSIIIKSFNYSMILRFRIRFGFLQVFWDPPSTFSPNSKNDDFTVLYVYEMKIWW